MKGCQVINELKEEHVSLCWCFQSDVKLIKAGDKVGASEATLLNMLKISPFTYGLEIEQGVLQC